MFNEQYNPIGVNKTISEHIKSVLWAIFKFIYLLNSLTMKYALSFQRNPVRIESI